MQSKHEVLASLVLVTAGEERWRRAECVSIQESE